MKNFADSRFGLDMSLQWMSLKGAWCSAATRLTGFWEQLQCNKWIQECKGKKSRQGSIQFRYPLFWFLMFLLWIRREMDAASKYNPEVMKSRFADYALGRVVLTRYNHKHYKIDDVDWTCNPLSTFPLKNGNLVSSSTPLYLNNWTKGSSSAIM
jgi:hypothetical protein